MMCDVFQHFEQFWHLTIAQQMPVDLFSQFIILNFLDIHVIKSLILLKHIIGSSITFFFFFLLKARNKIPLHLNTYSNKHNCIETS